MHPTSLIRFELYKIFSRKSLWVFLGILVVCLYLPMQISAARNNISPYYQATPPTVQQVQAAKADLKKIQPQFQQTTGKQQSTSTSLANRYYRDGAIVDSATGGTSEENLRWIQQRLNRLRSQGETQTYAYRADQLEYHMWEAIPFIGGGQYNGSGAKIIDFVKTYGLVIFGAMLLIGLAPLFSEEYSTGTDSFLETAKRGKGSLVTAKLLAAGTYVLAMEVLLQGVNVISNVILFGVQGLGYPLQSIPLYYSPFHLLIWQYILLATAIQFVGGLTFAAVIALISSISRSSLISFFLSAGLFVIPYLLTMFTRKPWAEQVLNFSYTGLVQVSRMFYRFVTYDFFGHPVLYPILLVTLVILITIPVVRLVYTAYDRHQVL